MFIFFDSVKLIIRQYFIVMQSYFWPQNTLTKIFGGPPNPWQKQNEPKNKLEKVAVDCRFSKPTPINFNVFRQLWIVWIVWMRACAFHIRHNMQKEYGASLMQSSAFKITRTAGNCNWRWFFNCFVRSFGHRFFWFYLPFSFTLRSIFRSQFDLEFHSVYYFRGIYRE